MSHGLLLDTCTFLWLAHDPARLPPAARRAIRHWAEALFVSAITAFEIGTKHARGRLELPLSPEKWFRAVLRRHGVRTVSISSRIALLATSLPALHRDPADRILVATGHIHKLQIVTPDPLLRLYSETAIVWE